MSVKKIRKRDGRLVEFDKEKIAGAIYKAAYAVGGRDQVLAGQLAEKVVDEVEKNFKTKYPTVEEVQDLIERTLLENHHIKTAKSFILYREKQARIRDLKKSIIGTIVSKDLSFNALKILKERYLLKDANSVLTETPEGMFRRVAKAVAKVDSVYNDFDPKISEEDFYQAISALDFLPNLPTMMNAGTKVQQMSACFVLPIEDSVPEIYSTLRNAAIVHQTGAGTGFSFSKLRPKGDTLSTKGFSSGPLPFIRLFDVSTETIKQGGSRRGANMGILKVDHPDILEFINAKENPQSLNNFNISVGITKKFMESSKKNLPFELTNPRNGDIVRRIPANEIFELLSTMAWKNGEPGVIFLDTINKKNPLPEMGELMATSPCGEVPLYPYESCALGSINLYHVVHNGQVDYEKLKKLVWLAVHFLDNVIDANNYPFKEVEDATKNVRKIGLGVMGFEDMLYALSIKYDSEEGLKSAETIMKFIYDQAKEASIELAKKRNVFPNWKKSIYADKGIKLRNATLLSIAPTGSISMIADCSSSIEPNFALSYVKKVLGTEEFLYVNKHFATVAREKNFYSEELMKQIASLGSIQHLKEIPKEVRDVFVTSHDVPAEYHVRMQAAFQKYVDNAVSKSVNLRHNANKEEIEKIFMLAYDLECKGITIYRDGSRSNQILTFETEEKKPLKSIKKRRVVRT